MNQRMFELARKASLKSHYKHKIGSVLVRKGKVVSFGHNKIKTNPRANTPFNMIHAELDVILNSQLKDFTDCSIYLYRELKNGQLAISKPCAHCKFMLDSLSIRNIYYSDYDGYKKD